MKAQKKTKVITFITTIMIMVGSFSLPVFAEDPTVAAPNAAGVTDALSNFAELIFTVIRMIGIIFTAWGIFNVGTSFSSHDASQRAIGAATIAGGLMMCFAKQIMIAIGAY